MTTPVPGPPPRREEASRAPGDAGAPPRALRVTRGINNNVVLALEDGADDERVVMGRGIGFKATPGAVLDPGRITQVFRPSGGPTLRRVIDLVEDLPADDLAVAIAIADDAERAYGPDVARRLLLPLADHLSYALRRNREGTSIDYPLQWEVVAMYPDEVAFARRALATVERMTGVRLPDVEAVPTALHLVNAQFGRPDIGRTVQLTTLMGELLRLVGVHLGRELDPGEISVSRFIAHMRFLVARGDDATVLTDGMGVMLRTMEMTYPDHLACAQRCRKVIEGSLRTSLSDDELVYLTIHIARVAA